MQITVFGAGGVGGYMAARLGSLLGGDSSALAGLSLVARGRHLEAIRERGLIFVDPHGAESVVRPTAISDDPAQLPRPDLVLLCVKGYDLDAALDAIGPQLGREGALLPLLNGANIDERIRVRLPGCVVYPGCIYISAFVEQPGRVRHAGGAGSVISGTSPDDPARYPAQFVDACGEAGIPLQWQDDPAPAIWEKFLFIAPLSLVTAVSGKSIGGVLEAEALRQDARAIMDETAAIARRKGVRLSEDIVEQTMRKAAGFPPQTQTSFQRDIADAGPRDERDIFAGTILRLGRQLGVPTPTADRYARALPPAAP